MLVQIFFKFYAKSAKEFLHVTERELKYDFFEYKHFSIIKMLALKTSHFWQLFSMNIRIFERTLSPGLGPNRFILISEFFIRRGESFNIWFGFLPKRTNRNDSFWFGLILIRRESRFTKSNQKSKVCESWFTHLRIKSESKWIANQACPSPDFLNNRYLDVLWYDSIFSVSHLAHLRV